MEKNKLFGRLMIAGFIAIAFGWIIGFSFWNNNLSINLGYFMWMIGFALFISVMVFFTGYDVYLDSKSGVHG